MENQENIIPDNLTEDIIELCYPDGTVEEITVPAGMVDMLEKGAVREGISVSEYFSQHVMRPFIDKRMGFLRASSDE